MGRLCRSGLRGRGNRGQLDAPGQRIDKGIHIVALAVGQQSFAGLLDGLSGLVADDEGVVVGVLFRFRLLRLRGRGRPGRWGRLRSRAGTAHGVVSAHEFLGAVHRLGVQRVHLHRETGGDRRLGRLIAGRLDGFTHRFADMLRHRLGRRGRLYLLAGGKLDRVALFAVDRAGRAAVGRRRGVLLGVAHRALDALQRSAFGFLGGAAGRAGVLAAPDFLGGGILRRGGLRHRRAGERRFLHAFLGDHQFLGLPFPAEQAAEKAVLFGCGLAGGSGFLVGVVFLLRGRFGRGLLGRSAAAA